MILYWNWMDIARKHTATNLHLYIYTVIVTTFAPIFSMCLFDRFCLVSLSLSFILCVCSVIHSIHIGKYGWKSNCNDMLLAISQTDLSSNDTHTLPTLHFFLIRLQIQFDADCICLCYHIMQCAYIASAWNGIVSVLTISNSLLIIDELFPL